MPTVRLLDPRALVLVPRIALDDEVEPAALDLPADLNWRMARHQAAVAHVFAKSAIGEQARRIWLMSGADGLSAKEIGAKLGLAANSVRAIRSRVAKMVAAVEAQFD